MRFVYLDSALSNNLGHHANSCRQIVGAARKRGIETLVLAHESVQRSLQAELAAEPYFRWFTYAPLSQTKWQHYVDIRTYKAGVMVNGVLAPFMPSTFGLAKWLSEFRRAVDMTTKDFSRIGLTLDDTVYINSAQSVQLAAAVSFLRSIPPGRRPRMILEFGVDIGAQRNSIEVDSELKLTDPSFDPRGTLYRLAISGWPRAAGPLPLTCATFDRVASDAYRLLLGCPITTLPLPRVALTTRRSRVGASPVTIGVLGHQREEKGYQYVPEIVRRVLDVRPNTRFLLHNGHPAELSSVQAELRKLAACDSRLILDERLADEPIWRALLDRSDLILCPYEPNRYRASYSAVAAEATAEAIPLVVPADTSLSAMAASDGAACTTFNLWEAHSIADAVVGALDRFDELAHRADVAAAKWPTKHGPQRLLDAILRAKEPAAS